MTPFWDFNKDAIFVGHYTGRTHKVGDKDCYVFVDEDGMEFLMNPHSMIERFVESENKEKKVEIIFKGLVNIKKSGNKFANYSISYFEDETETQTEKADAPGASQDGKKETSETVTETKADEKAVDKAEDAREKAVRKSGGSRLRSENRS